jgi:hypothetical protein
MRVAAGMGRQAAPLLERRRWPHHDSHAQPIGHSPMYTDLIPVVGPQQGILPTVSTRTGVWVEREVRVWGRAEIRHTDIRRY